ncbi:probable serine/threonine-protein kinase clkA [Uranotaenia lowii]|uniref:probable serine/threonine-protein kinase clkA n=1 Tax=Uranotaenia lowii TaxID=190385 RepID=UPI00247A4A8D|nr:probable serine/threonine-protein kinase clkA [Uranotaenia lowii]
MSSNTETNKTNQQGSDAPKASTTETTTTTTTQDKVTEVTTAAAATETSATKSDTKDEAATTKEKLSIHARKRRKWLLDIGYDFEEATELAKKHDFETLRKMVIQATDGKPAENTAANKTKKVRPAPMVITHKDYPVKMLEKEQVEKLKGEILKKVLEHKDTDEMKPGFEKCEFKTGYLRILPSDQETLDWLDKTIQQLEVSEAAELKFVPEKEITSIEVFVGEFPDSKDDSSEAILGFIESQNDGLKTSSWIVIDRKEVNDTVCLSFTVDSDSKTGLESRENKLKFKFGQVNLSSKDKPKSSAKPDPKVAVPSKKSSIPPKKTPVPPKKTNLAKSLPNQKPPVANIWTSNAPKFGQNKLAAQTKPVNRGNITRVQNVQPSAPTRSSEPSKLNVARNDGTRFNRPNNPEIRQQSGNRNVPVRDSHSNRNIDQQNDGNRRNAPNNFSSTPFNSGNNYPSRDQLQNDPNQPWANNADFNNRNLSRNEEIARFLQNQNNSGQNVFNSHPVSRNIDSFNEPFNSNRGNRMSSMRTDDNFINPGRSQQDSFDNRSNLRRSDDQFVGNNSNIFERRSNNDNFGESNRNQVDLRSNSLWKDTNFRNTSGQQMSNDDGIPRNSRFQDNMDNPFNRDNFDNRNSDFRRNNDYSDQFDRSNRNQSNNAMERRGIGGFTDSGANMNDSKFGNSFQNQYNSESNRPRGEIDFDSNRARGDPDSGRSRYDPFENLDSNREQFNNRPSSSSQQNSGSLNLADNFFKQLHRINEQKRDTNDRLENSFGGRSNWNTDFNRSTATAFGGSGNRGLDAGGDSGSNNRFSGDGGRSNNRSSGDGGRPTSRFSGPGDVALNNRFSGAGDGGSNNRFSGAGDAPSINRFGGGGDGGSNNRFTNAGDGSNNNRFGGETGRSNDRFNSAGGSGSNNRFSGTGNAASINRFGGGGDGGLNNRFTNAGDGSNNRFGGETGRSNSRFSGGGDSGSNNRFGGGGDGASNNRFGNSGGGSNSRNAGGQSNKRAAGGNMISYPIGLGQAGNVAKKFKNWT